MGQRIPSLLDHSSPDKPIDLSAATGDPPATTPNSSPTPTPTHDSEQGHDDKPSPCFPVCRNLSPSTLHLNLTAPEQFDTYIDPRDETTFKASISYRKTLDIFQENIYQNATAYDKTPPADLPGSVLRSTRGSTASTTMSSNANTTPPTTSTPPR